MWQYTDGHDGPPPHEVSGVGPCDCSQFNGDLEALRALWVGPAGGLPVG